jgi:hypothetical protein
MAVTDRSKVMAEMTAAAAAEMAGGQAEAAQKAAAEGGAPSSAANGAPSGEPSGSTLALVVGTKKTIRKRGDRSGSDEDERMKTESAKLGMKEKDQTAAMNTDGEEEDTKMERMMERVTQMMMGKVTQQMGEMMDEKLVKKLDSIREELKDDIVNISAGLEDLEHTMATRLEEYDADQIDFREQMRTWRTEIEQKVDEMALRAPAAVEWPKQPVMENEWQQVAEQKGKGKSKGKSGKDAKREEEMARTITAGSYGEGTAADDIIKHLEELMKDYKDDIDEVYSFGARWADRGAVRFLTREAMWKYMVARKGNHKHSWEGKAGPKSIYLSVAWQENEEKEQTTALRKAVRAVIETMKEEAEETKKNLTATYRTGTLKFKGVTWAQWSKKEEKMEWKTEEVQEAKMAAAKFAELTA